MDTDKETRDYKAVFIMWGGLRRKLADVCADMDFPYGVAYNRVQIMGWSPDRALQCPVLRRGRQGSHHTIEGLLTTVSEAGAKYGISTASLRYRMRAKGLSLEEAVKLPHYGR